jgi:hypothetical protein
MSVTESTGHFTDELLVAGELPAIDEFIAGVLRRAHETVEPLRAPGENRTILRVAHLFADALERAHLPFDRLQFIEAATEGPFDA